MSINKQAPAKHQANHSKQQRAPGQGERSRDRGRGAHEGVVQPRVVPLQTITTNARDMDELFGSS